MTLTVPLYRVAHGRTDDKGDRANISVIAWRPELYPALVAAVTEARVAQAFAHRHPTAVRRHEIASLAALNFVIDGVLDGGVNGSLNLDSHGKALAFHLLAIDIEVPASLEPLLEKP